MNENEEYISQFTGEEIDNGVIKANNSLQLPEEPLNIKQLIGINENGEQIDIQLGNDLELNNVNSTVILNILLNNIKNSLFPVGSIYFTVDNTNPSSLLGVGTWTQVASSLVTSLTENVFGNGLNLGLAGADSKTGCLSGKYADEFHCFTGDLGKAVGTTRTGTWFYGTYGVVSKNKISSNPSHSGLIVERTQQTIYIWKRTA